MKYIKIAFLFVVLSLVSCTRDLGETSQVSIDLPSFSGSSNHKSNVTVQGAGGDFNDSLNPTTTAGFNCYAVFVGGPEPEMHVNKCSNSSTDVEIFRFGPSALFFPAGSSIKLDVPSGSDREIIVAGVNANSGACKTFPPNSGGEPDSDNMSFPQVLSKKVLDLPPGEVQVAMTTSFDTNLQFDDCSFFSGGGGGGDDGDDGPVEFTPNYGIGTENKTLSNIGTTVDISAGQFCQTGECGAYGRVDIVSPEGTSFNLAMTSTGNAAEFSAGDEVQAIIMDAKGPGGPDGFCGGGPGEAHVGAIAKLTVDSVVGAVVKVSGDPEILAAVATQPPANLATDSGANNFCYLQLVKVVHLNDLTIAAGIELKAPDYNSSSDLGGGVVALRINGTLTFTDDSSRISASDAGHRGGLGGAAGTRTHGSGHGGVGGSMGGREANTNQNGAGGGGHLGPNTFSHPSGGAGALNAANSGGQAIEDNCDESGQLCDKFTKPLMGGSGGGGAAPAVFGGHGGGIVMIQARAVSILASTGKIAADGTPGLIGATANAGSGGGAGGWIQFMTDDISGGVLDLHAEGQSGGNGGASGGEGGGGGSGGFVGFAGCPGAQSRVNTFFGGGAGGSGTGPSGQSGELGGHVFGGFIASHSCPAALSIAQATGEIFFGHANLSTTTELTTQIDNIGDQTATVSSDTMGGDFQYKGGSFPGAGGTCTATIAAQSNCTIVVEYVAPASQTFSSIPFDITYNNGVQFVTNGVSMTGLAGLGELIISDGPVFDFGNVSTAGSSQHGFTITNIGTGSATSIAGQAFTGDFDYFGGGFPGTGGDCAPTLGAGGTCTVVVDFSPQSLGPHFDTFQVDYNDGIGTLQTTVDVIGAGIP